MVWATTKQGATWGSLPGAIVGCLVLVNADLLTDGTTHDALGAGAFGAVVGALVGSVCGLVLGVAAGSAASIARHCGGDRGAASLAGAVVAGAPLAMTDPGQPAVTIAGLVIGTIAGLSLHRVQRAYPEWPPATAPRRVESDPGWTRWGDPPT